MKYLINRLLRFGRELKRRNVVRVAVAYGIVAWVVMQIAAITFPHLNLPGWTITFVIVLALIGFPVALVLAWALEMTADGVRATPQAEPASPDEATGSEHSPAAPSSRLASGVVGAAIILLLAGGGFYYFYGAAPAPQTTAAAAHSEIRSVGVLPFVNMSASKENKFFSNGITEEILDALAQVDSLKVPARTSSFQFEGKNADIRTVAEKLDVEAVLEGSVRRAGEQVRITAQLINAETGYHLWSQSYDRTLRDVFAVQEDIAREIVDALNVHLAGGERLVRGQTSDTEAHELYLKAKQVAQQYTPQAQRRAIRYLKQAVGRDSTYAKAYSELARSHSTLSYMTGDESHTQAAERAARRAVRLDPNLSTAHLALSDVYLDRLIWKKAEHEVKRSRRLNPNSADAWSQYGLVLLAQGRVQEAARAWQRARDLNPLQYSSSGNLIEAYLMIGRYDQAEELIRSALELFPEQEETLHAVLARAHLLRDDLPAAEKVVRSALAEVKNKEALAVKAALPMRRGQPAKARAALDSLRASDVPQKKITMAQAFALGGERDSALQAIEALDVNLFNAANLSLAEFQPLRDAPRFQAKLRAFGL